MAAVIMEGQRNDFPIPKMEIIPFSPLILSNVKIRGSLTCSSFGIIPLSPKKIQRKAVVKFKSNVKSDT